MEGVVADLYRGEGEGSLAYYLCVQGVSMMSLLKATIITAININTCSSVQSGECGPLLMPDDSHLPVSHQATESMINDRLTCQATQSTRRYEHPSHKQHYEVSECMSSSELA